MTRANARQDDHTMCTVRTVVLALAAAACGPSPAVEEPPLHAPVLEARIWAGTTVTVRSPRIAKPGALPVVAESGVLDVAHAGGDSVVVVIPKTAVGPMTLTLSDARRTVVAKLDVAGFLGRTATPDIGHYPFVWPEGGRASIIGGSGGAVLRYEPGLGRLSTLLTGYTVSSTAGARTPGRTFDPALLLLQPIGRPDVEKWRLLPTPQVLDTLPFWVNRQIALLNDTLLLYATSHQVRLHHARNAGPWSYLATYEDTHEIVISPRRDLATLRVNGSGTGPPVFDLVRGDTAYHVRQLFRSYGARFSPNGDTLWMVGVTRGRATPLDPYPGLLLMMEAKTGRVLRSLELNDVQPFGFARDSHQPRLYIYALPNPGTRRTEELLVLDSRTLEEVGRVAVPAELGCGNNCLSPVIAAGIDGVFFVNSRWTYAFGSRSEWAIP